MKGLVFNEFLEMVAAQFSEDMLDDIIDAANLPTNGAYTAVGTYPHSELLALVQQLALRTGLNTTTLIKVFGKHLFRRFLLLYPHFFSKAQSAFELLESIEHHVHTEVRKLYPDAELPTFTTIRSADNQQLLMIYRSQHPFSALAEGLIEGCLTYYQEPATLQIVDKSEGHKQHVEFNITRIAT